MAIEFRVATSIVNETDNSIFGHVGIRTRVHIVSVGHQGIRPQAHEGGSMCHAGNIIVRSVVPV